MTCVKNFMKYRHLLAELVKKDIKLKYRRSYLGILWTLLEPLLNTLVLVLVFSNITGAATKNFAVYILTGRLLYTYFSNGTKAAMKSIRSNSGMIKKVYVPKYIYPLAGVLSNYVIFLISLIVLVIVSLAYRVFPTHYLIQAIVPMFLILVMTFGVGLILATLTVFFRDMEYLWSVALSLIMYTSAVFYQTKVFYRNGHGWILEINPLYSVIANFRDAVLYHQSIFANPRSLIISSVFSFATLIIGIILFYKKQDEFILHI